MKIKNKILIGVGVACTLALAAFAASPTYVTKSANGLAAAPAEVIFPADPTAQIRVVSANWLSDTNLGSLSFTTGVGAYSLTTSNAATSTVTNHVSSTDGLAANAKLVLQHGGVGYIGTLSSTNNGTNLVLTSGGWGTYVSAGDSIYQMSSATTLPVGATTNFASGEALYVGNPGRPVRVVLTPALVTNALNSVVVHYD